MIRTKKKNTVRRKGKGLGEKQTYDTEMCSDLYNYFSSQDRKSIQEQSVH